MRSQDITDRLKEIEDFLLDEYKENKEKKKRDWRTYEQQLMNRIKGAIKNLEPLINESINFKIHRGQGRVPELELKQKVMILLLKELFGKSNRMMASMLSVFSLLSGIDVSYKTVERLYSDPEVEIAIHNLHILILKKKGVKSEKEAFDRAMEMLKGIDIEIDSVRLDKYYSFPSYVDKFGEAKVYVIPRKNATLKGSWKWKDTMEEFVNHTLSYLEQYYLRNNSESGFSADKRWFGWTVGQKRDDRIETALSCTGIWHNLLNLYPS
ncbi:MAG: ISNCY family transposase [Methanosarcinales archaeon]|nr:ISNCY family transposase [Methanosarcinales archaeon]